ncbi:MAG: type II toxin-antitoxin system PemK/MazF family toxin [Terriglobales bacterium]
MNYHSRIRTVSLVRGDVVNVNFPVPSALRGRIQSGIRPGVIFNSTDALSLVPVVLVVPGTSKLGALRFPNTIQIDPLQSNGLTSPTVFLPFQMQAADPAWIGARLGALTTEELTKLENEVLLTLGFDPPDDD